MQNKIAEAQAESAVASKVYLTCMEHYAIDHSGPDAAPLDTANVAEKRCENLLAEFISSVHREDLLVTKLTTLSEADPWKEASEAGKRLNKGARDLLLIIDHANNARN